jgi:hypothetical protein
VQNHFNKLHLASCTPRFARSLKTKWGIIKHDVAKFIGNYIVVLVLYELGTCFEDMFHKALDLYKTKHPKHQASLPMKRKISLSDYNNINNNGV